MNHQETLRVDGGWLGTYYYKPSANLPPVRFEATFRTHSDGRLSGTILDDSTLGDANVSGTQNALIVHFTKAYVQSHNLPILYEGKLSEDGKWLRGKWVIREKLLGKIQVTLEGTWEAFRLWAEEEETAQEPDLLTEARRLLLTV